MARLVPAEPQKRKHMKRFLVVISALTVTPLAHAEALGGSTGVGWGYDPRSAFTFHGKAIGVDAQPQSEDWLSGRWVNFEPGSVLAPSFRLQYTELYARPTDLRPGATDYLAGETLSSDTTLDQYDAMFYYEVGGGAWGSVDLGVNLRYLDATLVTADPAGVRRDERGFSAYIPMFYAKALFDLPFEGFSAGIEGSSIQYHDNRVLDYEAKVAYELNTAFGLQGGWRHQRLKLDDGESLGTDLQIQGPFLDFYYNF